MKEIKFRAFWNNEIEYDVHLGTYSGRTIFEILNDKDYPEDYLKVMQYTGLKDKNSKEIYEGDIIEFRANYCSDNRNGYHKGVIKWDDNYMRFNIYVEGFEQPFDCANETDEWHYKREVIGNIYENKDLI